MRITLIESGRTRDPFIREGVEMFRKRVEKYAPFRIETVPEVKNAGKMTMKEVKEKEGILLLKRIRPDGHMVLLDERGTQYDSIAFARHLNSLEGRVKELQFVIGGPFGFSEALYERADDLLSLSKLTFSHQLIRVIFMEQLYRAFTILKGEPYHHA